MPLWHRILLITVTSLICLVSIHWGHSRLVAPLSGEGLRIDEKYLDFGTAIAQSDFVWKLPLENCSEHPIEIAGFERSCGCASVSPSMLTVAPGETRWLMLNLNLDARKDFLFSGGEREFSVELRPLLAKSMTHGPPWRVAGVIQSPFRIAAYPLHFPANALVAGSEFPALEFTVEPRTPAKEWRVELAPISAKATVSCESRDGAVRIALRPDAQLAPGTHEFRLSIAQVGAENRPLPAQTLSVTARVVPDVAIEPAYLRFDGASTGTPRVRLFSRSGADFEVVRVEAPTGLLNVTRTEAKDGESGQTWFEIGPHAQAAELSVCEVVFHLRSANERIGDIAAPLQVVMRP